MTSKIKVLSEETINQIAAGEVIEHPASVVKELVENSLDAGSRQVIIEVLSGGFQLIRITDDGCGMSPDDAVLSLERHATSKVRKLEDLLQVTSMGFRGEALASIAAISKLTLITSATADHQGVCVVCEGGKIKRVEPHARTQGTTIEVKALFYTTPARKKFQKSPAQALAEIHKTVSSLALSRSDVAFRLISHDQCLIEAARSTTQARIEDVLGADYIKGALPILYQEPWIKIEGWIGAPTTTRSNRTGQYVFINQRVVSSASISFAVSDGYGTMLGVKKYPVFVLHLTLSSELLDVNVHPQKKEVRFKEEGPLKEVIRKAIALGLQGGLCPASPSTQKPVQATSVLFSDLACKKPQDVKEFYMHNIKTPEPITLSPTEELLPWRCERLPQVADLSVIGIYRCYLLMEGQGADKVLKPPYLAPPYEGLLALNLRSAIARIYLDEVMHGTGKTSILDRQALLFPVTVSVSAAEALLLEAALPLMETLGIDISAFGKHVFMIDACASVLDEERIQELLEDLLGELKTVGLSQWERQKKLAIRASQQVQRKKKFYDIEEAKTIVSTLLKTEQPYFCPLGKKIIACLNLDEGKFFKNE